MIVIETFDDQGYSKGRRIIKNPTTVCVKVNNFGDITILSPEQFCKTCNGSGGVRYHYAQDLSISCDCPTCNNGDPKRWEQEKINWNKHNTNY